MKKSKKNLCYILISLILLVSFNIITYAASFPDVQSENWSWAKQPIQDMTNRGIIAGFPDGTFKPSESVTKLQSLILLSRISGVDQKINEDYVEIAEDIYKSLLNSYEIPNKREIAYLLYKNILNEEELHTYISSVNYDEELKRYEAAILLTKIMGQESLIKNKTVAAMAFEDSSSIPANAKAYVEYVNKEGIMKGMSESEFGPMVNVSRAQMAVMLYRTIERNDKIEETIVGTIMEKDTEDNIIKVQTKDKTTEKYEIEEKTILKQNGRDARLNDFVIGSKVILTKKSNELYMVESITPDMDMEVSGVIKTMQIRATIKKIKIEVKMDVELETEEYELDDDVIVIYNDKSSKLETLVAGDYAKLYLKNGRVKKIEAEGKTKETIGIIEDIILIPSFKLKIRHEDDTVQDYEVTDNIMVTKNRKNSTLRDIEIGDKVELTLEYYKINKIVAKSETASLNGIIEEIIISKNPSIKIKEAEKENTYTVKRDADIWVDNKEGTIYDLRLGYAIQFTTDGNSITKMETKAPTHSQQITGVVESINDSYGFLNIISTEDSSENKTMHQVFVKKNAKIIRSTDTRTMYLRDIKEGDVVTAIGTVSMGVFEANTIVIISE